VVATAEDRRLQAEVVQERKPISDEV